MKVQCPSCREIVEMKDFSTSSQGLSFECANCNTANFLANPQVQDSILPQAKASNKQGMPQLAEGKLSCPKCGHVQEDTYACHRCGLVFSKLDPNKLPAPPPEAAELWKKAEENLEDEKWHDDFIKSCLRANRLDYAVRQYRLLSHSPGYEELGKKMLALVSVRGQAQLPVEVLAKRLHGRTKKGIKTIAWILAAAVLGFAAYYGWSVIKLVLEEKTPLP